MIRLQERAQALVNLMATGELDAKALYEAALKALEETCWEGHSDAAGSD